LKEYTLQLKSLSATEVFGVYLGQIANPGDVICLDGDLGAGKTTLTQAIARGLDVDNSCYVTSPSFAIMHEYPGRIPLFHMDFYRLQDAAEVEDLGFDEYFYMAGLTVIEWSERAVDILPQKRLSLKLTLNNDESRTVVLEPGAEYEHDLLLLVNKCTQLAED
jgi:tRNA threonylcarbamoyladenosine biosynthesis protein TsaE